MKCSWYLAKKVVLFLALGLSVMLTKVTTYAKVTYDFLKTEQDSNPFEKVQGVVDDSGIGLYKLSLTAAILGLLIALILCGLGFAMSKQARRKEEQKNQLIWITIGGAFVFGAISLAGILGAIGASLS